MATYYITHQNKLQNICAIVLCVFGLFICSPVLSQEHVHGVECGHPEFTTHAESVYQKISDLESSTEFAERFEMRYNFAYSLFIDVNRFFINSFRQEITEKTFREKDISANRIENLLYELVDRARNNDDLWFQIPADHGIDKIYYGKHGFNPIPKKDEEENVPKTLLCLNAGFENNNWTGWETICATASNGLNVTNLQPYSPPAGCTSPAGSPQQHSLWTGGTDAIGGFPRVFNGGVSAMIGNGAQANSPQHQAAVLRKTFVVDPNNTLITYSYAAVLDNGGGHPANEQPFFNVRLTIDGAPYNCAAYSATAGDGQAGWQTAGNRFYRDWTTIAVPLQAYIGSTVVLEFSVSDCFVSGGTHYAYAYIDVSCDNMEVDQFCQGGSTVLSAPSSGIVAYEWNTGETTQQITITTPGVYSVYVQPYGSPCSALLTYNASLYPVPTADFSVNNTSVCVGGDVDFTNLSTVEPGGTITSYQWNYGDGINTPVSPGGTITGVAQTTGSYETTNNHVYNILGNQNVVLTIQTSDGCTDTQQATISVIQGPQAAISGNNTVCLGDSPPSITFTGSQTPGPYTFTYNINGGTNQTVTTTSGTTVTVPVPTSPAGTYTYNITHVSDPASATCQNNVTGSATVIVNPLPTATIGTSATVCQGAAAPIITFTGSNGTSEYQFIYTVNGGAPQTVTTSGSNSVTVSVSTATAASYVYDLVSVTDVTTGCSQTQTGSATITVNLLPSATTAGTVSVCQGSTAPVVTFTGQNGSQYAFSYTVNGGPVQVVTTTSGSSSATISQSTTTPGTFVYELVNVTDPTSLCNQDVSLTETIIVRQLPVANISAPVEACHMDAVLPTVQFTGADGDAPYTFTYTINGGANQFATSTGSTSTFQVPTGTVGTFTYTITNVQEGSALGCQQAQNISTLVTIHALPNVSAGNDFTVCAGTQIVLTGSGAQTYDWTNGVTNGVPFTPTDTTTYTVEGTDNHGCKNTDQITVNVVPIPVMDIDGVNLAGCSPVIPTLTNNSTGNLTNCTWYLGNGAVLQGCGSVSSTFEYPGCYDVTLVVSTPEGCSNTLTLTNYICVEQNPIADFYPNPDELTTYNWESQMVNESSNAHHYEWDFGDGSPISTEHSPTHAYPNEEAGTYTVMLIASTNGGCVDTAYAVVNVKEELLFYVPNTFTPDGDAFNETFKPVFTTGYDPYNYSLYIYNRWGEMVFESHDTSIGWNGRYGVDGKICQDGTYTWKIEVKRRVNDERLQYLGHVNIIR